MCDTKRTKTDFWWTVTFGLKILGNQNFGLFLNNTACLGGCTDRLVILGKVRFGNFEILTPFFWKSDNENEKNEIKFEKNTEPSLRKIFQGCKALEECYNVYIAISKVVDDWNRILQLLQRARSQKCW
jgi:hypothetical protein